MVATIKRLAVLRSSFTGLPWPVLIRTTILAAVMFVLAQRAGLWPLAAVMVTAAELWLWRLGQPVSRAGWAADVKAQMPALVMGLATVVIIATVPRLISQVVIVGLYVGWRVWWARQQSAALSLAHLLVVTAVMFEAIFLAAAIWRTPDWLTLVVAWAGSYITVYSVLSQRHERAAGVLAAAWAVIAVEVSWVLLLWLFTYTMSGGYVLVPQPALILTSLGYCFGNIYLSQREGSLSRARLAEYLIIGLILIAIVVVGTSWHGTV